MRDGLLSLGKWLSTLTSSRGANRHPLVP